MIVRNYDKVSIINKKAPSSTSDVSKYGTEAKLGAITDNTTLSQNVNTPLPLFQTEKEMLSYAAEFA